VIVPGILYYVTLSFAKAQEIGLAAVEDREPDFDRIRIWQIVLYFLILGAPIIIISLVLMALHLNDLTILFSLADVTIFYLVPMAVAANGSAVDGIEQCFKLFRANPTYVCLCGAVPAIIIYAVSILPLEFGIYLRQQSPSSILASLITVIGSIASTILLIRYEPFYRAQIYQSMVEPSTESMDELVPAERTGG
ncbi:MAG TPA: hypothetical protein VFD13_01565, partial [Candidatus Kapabacteria bacterium]|nr:hypothetical protein [Candidatus Kapabacteria bacterium]